MAEPAPAAHRFPFRIHWEATDAAGIVYYANYLRFIERGRSDWVRGAGIDQVALLARQGITFQVRRCLLDYLAPARLADERYRAAGLDEELPAIGVGHAVRALDWSLGDCCSIRFGPRAGPNSPSQRCSPATHVARTPARGGWAGS